jgi:hypothetical protein
MNSIMSLLFRLWERPKIGGEGGKRGVPISSSRRTEVP